MNKIYQLLLFIGVFVYIVSLYAIQDLSIKPMYDYAHMLFEKEFALPLLPIVIFGLLVARIQTIFGIIFSIVIIKNKEKLYLLYKIFDNFLVPTTMLVIFLLIDIGVNYFYQDRLFIHYYNFFTALTTNFLPFYVIALINILRLKLSRKSEQNVL